MNENPAMTLEPQDVLAAAEAIRLEMRTFRVAWFVEDAATSLDESNDLTPYMCLAVAALRAARLILPEGY